ncbi:epoxide hydrolase family protein [Streptomyces sp. NPDC101132]|uniref:epoxide hydrolase family protein n=1 Tax=Streptomyces sp. NPDC101132 TaxID=3366110 RepID=UPI00381E7207
MINDSVLPFRVDVPQAVPDDLRKRLDLTRWPDELSDVGREYGVPREHPRSLVSYWRHAYDGRAAEAGLNAWSQYTTVVDGTRVHFAHPRSPEPDALPLPMTHGRPASIVGFQEVAGLPSIPGFGFSGPTTAPGREFKRVAAVFGELMRRLGYERYGVQGGDRGAAISRELGRTRPDEVVGVHLNLLPGALAPGERARALASWERTGGRLRGRQGYADLQSTRPPTPAYAPTDSPAGQLALIAAKFAKRTNRSVRWAEYDRGGHFAALKVPDLLVANVRAFFAGLAGGPAAGPAGLR